jgi:general secretion pathway protein J
MTGMPMTRQYGFTLIEVLVAFLIFAIIGVISSQILSQTVNSREDLANRGERLAQIHRAMQIMQRDFMQLTSRPIRDQYGDPQRPLMIGTDGAIEFTRVGWRNPLKGPRSEVQRVGYLWQDDALVRGYWRHADRSYDSEPNYQTLLEEVDRIEFYALDVNGNEHTFWPLPGVSPEDPNFRLAGVLVRIEAAPFGLIERVWEVPGV